MSFLRITQWIALLSWMSLSALAGLTPEQREKLPPPVAREVNFSQDIKPIFEASCVKCHGRGKDKGGFAIDMRETLLKGGDSGPAVISGKSSESLLIELVSGLDLDNIMPQKGSRLTAEQVGLLRKWIDQGIAWDSAVSFGKLPPINLHPRKPELPGNPDYENPVDRFVYAYFEKANLKPPAAVEDRIYARRVYLDVIGVLPTPRELETFLLDKSPDKRQTLVATLLGREVDYAQHWLSFWNDALRNDYKGTGYIDGGRKQITSWLFAALVKNKPYHQFVSELINPSPDSEGFAKGIVWRGVVNASQTPQMQAAQNISQVFMGANLKCASCHDSFINDWTLADAYGLASIYAEEPLEMFKCDVPTGRKAAMKFIFPELGGVDATAPKKERLGKLAEIVTSDRNGRLTRTIVNRFWARFMGRGLIEPVDEMENPAWNQDLLDWLAADLSENGYNLKRTIKLILTSRAYQLPAVPVSEIASKNFIFTGPLIRRMSAEQFTDAVTQITGVHERSAAARLNVAQLAAKDVNPDLSDRPVQPKWIWSHARASQKAEPAAVLFRKFIELPVIPTDAAMIIAADNSFRLFVNGKEAGTGKDFTAPATIDVRKYLREGINLVAIGARNAPGAPDKPDAEQSSPAGLWVYARIRAAGMAEEAEKVMDFGTDSTWLWAMDQETGWEKPLFSAANWNRAVELGGPASAPWKIGQTLAVTVANVPFLTQARACFANNDPLMTALGRSNREQIVTTRPSVATTLQALELTNGSTLAVQLKKAGQQLALENISGPQLIANVYQKAFGRLPTKGELELSSELVGSPVRSDGVEDLLWAMTMLPEFQLIY
jgi:hypothetical protein